MKNFYFRIDESTKQYEIEDCSLNGIEDVLIDNDIQNFIHELCAKNPTIKKAVGSNFNIEDIWGVKEYIEKNYAGKSVRIYNNIGEEVKSYSLIELYNALINWHLSDENFDLEICILWSEQLQNFIDEGLWHVGMIDNNGNATENIEEWPVPFNKNGENIAWRKNEIEYSPIIWFGLSNRKIFLDWVIGTNGIKALIPIENGLGDYGCQHQIQGLEINYNLLFGPDFLYWYFGCCGNEGAYFSKILDSCPICLTDLYKNKNGKEMVANYCLKMIGHKGQDYATI